MSRKKGKQTRRTILRRRRSYAAKRYWNDIHAIGRKEQVATSLARALYREARKTWGRRRETSRKKILESVRLAAEPAVGKLPVAKPGWETVWFETPTGFLFTLRTMRGEEIRSRLQGRWPGAYRIGASFVGIEELEDFGETEPRDSIEFSFGKIEGQTLGDEGEWWRAFHAAARDFYDMGKKPSPPGILLVWKIERKIES